MINIQISSSDTDLKNLYDEVIKMNKNFSSYAKQKERSKKHGCDGICYSSTHMCPQAEYCDETRLREFIATMISFMFLCLVRYLLLLLEF